MQTVQNSCSVCHCSSDLVRYLTCVSCCSSCILQYLISNASYLNGQLQKIVCLCGLQHLSLKCILKELKPQQKQKLFRTLTLKYLRANPDSHFCSNCQQYFLVDGDCKAQCPSCKSIQLIQTSQNCLTKFFSRIRTILSTKECPGCKAPIYRISGCNMMKCQICKTKFCFNCSLFVEKKSGRLVHQIQQCDTLSLIKLKIIVATLLSLFLSVFLRFWISISQFLEQALFFMIKSILAWSIQSYIYDRQLSFWHKPIALALWTELLKWLDVWTPLIWANYILFGIFCLLALFNR